jgi:hypothetical protein
LTFFAAISPLDQKGVTALHYRPPEGVLTPEDSQEPMYSKTRWSTASYLSWPLSPKREKCNR